MTNSGFLSNFKDICLSGAVITTAIVAWRGLASWQKELKGKADFEVARNFIRATFKLREEIQHCRSPFLSSGEFPENYHELKDKTAEDRGQGLLYVYKNRRKGLKECFLEFDALTIEAEALWGEEAKSVARNLEKCVSELSVSIDMHIRNEFDGGEIYRNDPDFGKEIRHIVSDIKQDENPFTLKLNEAIKSIENYVRPYMVHHGKGDEIGYKKSFFQNLKKIQNAITKIKDYRSLK